MRRITERNKCREETRKKDEGKKKQRTEELD